MPSEKGQSLSYMQILNGQRIQESERDEEDNIYKSKQSVKIEESKDYKLDPFLFDGSIHSEAENI